MPTVCRHILGALPCVEFRAHSNTTSNLWMRNLKLGSRFLGDTPRGWEARIPAPAGLSPKPTFLTHSQDKSAQPSAPKVFMYGVLGSACVCARACVHLFVCACLCALVRVNYSARNRPPHLQWADLHGEGAAFFCFNSAKSTIQSNRMHSPISL